MGFRDSQTVALRQYLNVGTTVTDVEGTPTIAVDGWLVRRLPRLGIRLRIRADALCFAHALRRVAYGVELDRQDQRKA
jgi:hypothetical protein